MERGNLSTFLDPAHWLAKTYVDVKLPTGLSINLLGVFPLRRQS